MNGTVYFVGAGPGDPLLLTLKATLLLKRADSVLVDALVHPNCLRYCRKDAEIISVGKRKGKHSQAQDSINQLLLDKALLGKMVVRLKGGDPGVFGRLGEEISFLHAHKIPYVVVPGISSALSAPLYSGFPLTHRDLSRSVAFLTGTLKKGEENLDIPQADTLVFLMAGTHISKIVARLLELPKFSESTPAALLSHGTLSTQQSAFGTLGTIESLQKDSQAPLPALFVVGAVAELGKTLSWVDFQPLAFQRIVLLRTLEQAQYLYESLSLLGAEVLLLPMIETQLNPDAISNLTPETLSTFSTLIFTSANGVTHFMSLLLETGQDTRSLSNKKIVAIGPKTAAKLNTFGLIADLVPSSFDADSIIHQLGDSLKNKTILLPTTEKADTSLQKELSQKGASITRVNVYKTLKPDTPKVPLTNKDWVVFTSSSTAEHFFMDYPDLKPKAFSIGHKTTETLTHYLPDSKIVTAKKSTTDSLLELLYSPAS